MRRIMDVLADFFGSIDTIDLVVLLVVGGGGIALSIAAIALVAAGVWGELESAIATAIISSAAIVLAICTLTKR